MLYLPFVTAETRGINRQPGRRPESIVNVRDKGIDVPFREPLIREQSREKPNPR